MGLEQPRDLPAAARHLQRDPVRQQALRQRRETIRRARHATDGADLPVLANRDHTEIAVHIQADRTTNPSRQRHLSPPSTVGLTVSGRTSGTTTQTDTSSQLNPGKSQGRPNEKRGSKPIDQNGLPVCVLPRKPLSRMSRKFDHHRAEPSTGQFHASKRSTLGREQLGTLPTLLQ